MLPNSVWCGQGHQPATGAARRREDGAGCGQGEVGIPGHLGGPTRRADRRVGTPDEAAAQGQRDQPTAGRGARHGHDRCAESGAHNRSSPVSMRHFAAWLGLTPKERATGGRHQPGRQRTVAAVAGGQCDGGDLLCQTGEQNRLGLGVREELVDI